MGSMDGDTSTMLQGPDDKFGSADTCDDDMLIQQLCRHLSPLAGYADENTFGAI